MSDKKSGESLMGSLNHAADRMNFFIDPLNPDDPTIKGGVGASETQESEPASAGEPLKKTGLEVEGE